MKVTNSHPSMTDLQSSFIAEYAAWLYGCGATCTRITKNVDRMAKAWNLDGELVISPDHVTFSLNDESNCHSRIYIKKHPHKPISFYKNTALSTLSWEVADGKLTFEEAQNEFNRITNTPLTNPWLVLFLTSVANMSFCRIFGGDAWAMAIVFLATLLGFRLKQILLDEHLNVNVVFFLCAFFSSIIGATGYVFHISDTPDVALATCVLYLIPGVPYINSISDLMGGQYLVCFSRFMNALLLTFCLSVGLASGVLLMNLKLF
ncbi:MAG: threonine/serine exporter family protein [Prevotella sp.]|nr:threonine/serine exporter family protein [Prevotellaceae bacterium]MDY3936391.1 threonine/serine exporter family protein [Prevotella sp.]